MTNKIGTIVVVDDEPMIIELISSLMQDAGYQTVSALNGQEALDIINSSAVADISAIISDIKMPIMDGYQLCHALREHDTCKNIPFIFASSLTTLDEKIQGYNAGADDYIPKPIEPDELLLKVKRLAEKKQGRDELTKQLLESQNAAMQALSYTSDLGRVVNFYEEALLATSIDDLAKKLFRNTASYGLSCILAVVDGDELAFIGDQGYVSPLEQGVIELARSQTRFYHFGKRTIVNYGNHSLLVKNMPVDDENKYGMINDMLGALCNAIYAKLTIFMNERREAKQKDEILSVVRHAVDNIDEIFTTLQNTNSTVIEDMCEQMDTAIMGMGLLEDTENNIESITKECLERSNDNFSNGLKLNTIFDGLREEIDLCLTSNISNNKPQQIDSAENECDSGSDPELF
ncbi:MAG: response regulator [Chromatiales bacterium]|nr:response regulator [Chromatiales bacterium]